MSARVTEAMVEAGARAAFDTWWANRGAGYETSWLSTKRQWLDQARACPAAALSAEPGEAEKKRAPVDYYKVLKRFAEEDGSIREGRLTALSFALAAAPLPEESRHGR